MSSSKAVAPRLIQLCLACIFCILACGNLAAQESIVTDLLESFFGAAEKPVEVPPEGQPVQPDEETALDADVPATDAPFGPPVENATPASSSKDKKIDILDDYQAAVSMAQLHQRPLFIVFGADWCSWCRKLEKELTQPEAEPILRQWIVAKVDVDANPEVAQKMSASALPALRILANDQSIVARQEGYLPIDELRAWLDQNLSQADPAIQKVLYDSGNVSEDDLKTLIGFLSNRSPVVRRAASDRITSAKSDCAGAIVDILRAGKLSQRLSALEILTTWRAPIENLDPWLPESITEQSIAPMMDWLRNQATTTAEPSTAPAQLDSQQAASIIESYINSNEANAAAAMSEAIRYGNAVVPEIRVRLAASELSDANRVKLRKLLYRCLAGERLRLRNHSQFSLLAGLDAQTRRDAAEQLLFSATSQDEPLIEELASDTDVLIREMSVPKLQDIGALQDKARLARLLADKSPSVRTAVLRKLSENPKASSIEILIQYIQSETDEDLLVYAAKTLGQLGSSNGAEDALVKLVSTPSWRIRAAALDSIAETIKKNERYSYNDSSPSVSSAVADAVLKATNDADNFVSARASAILPTTISTTSAESIALYLFEHQDQLKNFEEAFHEYEREKKLAPLTAILQKWLKGDDAAKIRCAATVLAKLSPSLMQAQLPSLLQSSDRSTQLAAMAATVQSLALYRNNELQQLQAADAPTVEPWFSVPDHLKFNSKSKKNKSAPVQESPSGDSEQPEAAQAPPSDPSLNALDGLFGDAKVDEPAPEPVVEDKSKSEAQSLDALSDFFGDAAPIVPAEATAPSKKKAPTEQDKDLEGLASQWLAKWYAQDDHKDEWISHTLKALRDMHYEQTDDNATALRWHHLSLLSAGDVAQNAAVAADLATPTAAASNDLAPTFNDVLPWLLPEDRLRYLSTQAIDWSQMSEVKKGNLLLSATEIDDLPIADWIFSSLNKPDLLHSQDTHVVHRLFMRALLGHQADSLSAYVYTGETFGAGSSTPHGSARAWQWLKDHFDQTQSAELRASILSAASYIDHSATVKTCIGYVAQAEKFDDSVKVSALTALADNNPAASFIARAWLAHPLPEIRDLAVDRLLSTPSKFLEHWHESDVRFVYDYNLKLPSFWTEKESVSSETLSQAIATATSDSSKQKLRLLLLAYGGPVALQDIQFTDEANQVLLVGALAKRKEFGDDAIAYCEKLADSVTRDNAPMMYVFCKSITNDRVAQIRKRMRDKFGAEVLEL